MKTKLYFLITGLLMATCITSFAQEIVNNFTLRRPDKEFLECNLLENKDGTLMFRTLMCNPNTYDEWQHLIYKTTPEGEILDSLIIDGAADYSYFFRNPLDTDSYILTEDHWTFNEIDSVYTSNFRMIFVDANLNINDDISVPLYDADLSLYYVSWDRWFIDPQNDFIISFWTDNEHHFRRVGLDGTLKTAHDDTSIFNPNYESEVQQPGGDSLLIYSSMGFGTFSESPLTYYLLGGYYPSSGPWPIVGYLFDADFNLIDSHLYELIDENFAYDGGNNEHIIPLENDSYLIAIQAARLSPSASGVAVAQLDMNHNLIKASPLFGTSNCFPRETLIAEDGTVYQLYDNEGQYKASLARLDGDLNLNWDLVLPGNQTMAYWGTSLIMLGNGDIAVAYLGRKSMRYCATIVILHDDYDSTPEMTSVERPFTLYPNPVKNQLNITFAEGTEPESVHLFDLQGRMVGTKCNGLESIDMSALSAGVYMLRITMNDGASYYEKVIKK